jgi:hypothetical protein
MTDPKIQELGAELMALEKRAGVDEKAESARLGPMFPNLEASPDEYFKEVEYSARRGMRKLYFAVGDLALRKELIAKLRECGRALKATRQTDINTARQKLATAQRRARSLPWIGAGTLAVLCVAAGAYFFQVYGAIGGALMGFFLGQGNIASHRNSTAEEVRTSQEELDELLKTERENEATPEWFNASEERTGARDEDFDRVSVYSPSGD